MQRYALGRRGLDSRTKTFGASRKRGKVTGLAHLRNEGCFL
jgi:hypothetical protein